MIYVDYVYYYNEYIGRKIPEKDFEELSVQAQRFVDYVTGGKICGNVTDKVRNAVCAAAEALYDCNSKYVNLNPGIKSENTDGYSVTYQDYSVADISAEQDKAMYKAVRRALSGTGLLYRGVHNAH